MTDEPTLASRRVYTGRILDLRVDTVRLPDGTTSQREIIEHSPSVVIVPVDAEGRVLLVRQYRKAPEKTLLEAPAGGLEAAERPEDGALRELQEEVGFTAGSLRHLGGFWLSPGFCTEYMDAYLATDLTPSSLPPDPDETIEVVPVPWAEALAMVYSGEVEDAKSIAAILLASRLIGADE